jgi:hypothetical protein
MELEEHKVSGMRTDFEILIRRKIPYWSDFLMGLMSVCFLFLFLLYLFMSPSEKASDEMKVAYFILVVPEWLKEYSFYSLFGLVLLIPIYHISKLYKVGQLDIRDHSIQIRGGGHDKRIEVDTIKKIMLNDVTRFFRKPHNAMEIIIFQKPKRKSSFLLRHYVQAEEVVDALAKLQGVELSVSGGFELQTFDEDEI